MVLWTSLCIPSNWLFCLSGRGSDVMQPMAIPSVGGMSVALITLFVIPCCYCLVKEWQVGRRSKSSGEALPISVEPMSPSEE